MKKILLVAFIMTTFQSQLFAFKACPELAGLYVGEEGGDCEGGVFQFYFAEKNVLSMREAFPRQYYMSNEEYIESTSTIFSFKDGKVYTSLIGETARQQFKGASYSNYPLACGFLMTEKYPSEKITSTTVKNLKDKTIRMTANGVRGFLGLGHRLYVDCTLHQVED